MPATCNLANSRSDGSNEIATYCEDARFRTENHKRKRSLLCRKDYQVAAADALRKAQIRNANQHYLYESRRAEVQCEVDLGEHLGPSINVETRLDQASESRRLAPHAISSLHHFAENNTDFSTIRLQEELICEDLSEVARHCQSVSRQLLKSVPQDVSVAVTAESQEIQIGVTTYSVGDMVVCFSTLSQESFHGMISDVTSSAVLVVCGNSARFSLAKNQIEDGRVVVSNDIEAFQNLSILKKYSKMLSE